MIDPNIPISLDKKNSAGEGWMDDSDCAEECGPDGEPVQSGPIVVTFNGDCVDWEYANERNNQ